MTNKPKCKLVGTDGNVFALAGRVSACLKQHGKREEAQEVSKRLWECDSYESALALFSEYVDIH